MNIVIDMRWIGPQGSGVGTYARELIRELLLVDPQNHYWLLFENPTLRDTVCSDVVPPDAAARVQPVTLRFGVFSLRNQIELPLLLRRLGATVFHSPNYMIPLLSFRANQPGPPWCIVTLHDVIPLRFPHHAPRARKSRLYPLFRWVMKAVGRRAHAILTVSHASREDILRFLRIPLDERDKVRVVYNGVSNAFRPAAQVPHKDHEARCLLYVGRSDPYKNLEGLVQAFARLRTMMAPPVKLRLVGPRDPRYPEAQRLAQRLGVAEHVEATGYLAPEALVQAYQSADALVHPSRYEGFGLQVLEAMACGTPVVCSNRGALPEVVGDAALLVDPDDIDGLAQAMHRVLTDDALARELATRGLRRAAEFTWRRAAVATLAVYLTVGIPKRKDVLRR